MPGAWPEEEVASSIITERDPYEEDEEKMVEPNRLQRFICERPAYDAPPRRLTVCLLSHTTSHSTLQSRIHPPVGRWLSHQCSTTTIL